MFGPKQQVPAQADYPYIPAVVPAVEAPVQVTHEQPILAVHPKMNNNDLGVVYKNTNAP